MTQAGLPTVFVRNGSAASGILKPVPCVCLVSPESWCPKSLALQREGTRSKQHFAHSKFYISDASGKVYLYHLEFYIAQSVIRRSRY